MTGFRQRNRKRFRILYSLRERGRDRSPADLKIYPSSVPATAKTARGKTVSAMFNAIAIPERLRFTFKMYGKPINYHGVVTKRYGISELLILLGISRPTLYRWIERQLIPEPYMRVRTVQGDRLYWLYHQVQPLYVWYMHLKARGIEIVREDQLGKEIAVLRRQLFAQERRFQALFGVELVDNYTEMAGRYGVIPLTDD